MRRMLNILVLCLRAGIVFFFDDFERTKVVLRPRFLVYLIDVLSIV